MLMVLFDILVSHRRMSRWHEKRIQQHLKDQQATQQAKLDLQRRLNSNAEASTSQSSAHQASSFQHPDMQAFTGNPSTDEAANTSSADQATVSDQQHQHHHQSNNVSASQELLMIIMCTCNMSSRMVITPCCPAIVAVRLGSPLLNLLASARLCPPLLTSAHQMLWQNLSPPDHA